MEPFKKYMYLHGKTDVITTVDVNDHFFFFFYHLFYNLIMFDSSDFLQVPIITIVQVRLV